MRAHFDESVVIFGCCVLSVSNLSGGFSTLFVIVRFYLMVPLNKGHVAMFLIPSSDSVCLVPQECHSS